jgi:WD40 repeat protein
VTVANSQDGEGHSVDGDTLGRLWDAETGKEVGSLRGPYADSHLIHPPAVFSPDGRLIITQDYFNGGGYNADWILWDAKDGKTHTILFNRKHHSRAAVTPDGQRLALFGPTLDWYNLDTRRGERVDNIRGSHPTLSPDGQRLVTVDGAGLHIWAVAGLAERKLGHWEARPALAASPDGLTLATRGYDPDEVIFWDIATAQEISRIKAKELTNITSSRYSPDGSRFICKSWLDEKKWCVVAEVRSGKLAGVIPCEDDLRDYDISSDNSRVVTIYDNQKKLRIWDLANNKELAVPKLGPADQYLSQARFSPDGLHVVTDQTKEHRHCLRDGITGKEVAVLHEGWDGGSYSPASPLFSPNSKYVVTVWNSSPESVYVWETATGNRLAKITAPPFGGAHITAPRFSDDSEWIIIPCDSTVHVWEAATGKEVLVLKGHGDVIKTAVFNADKTRIVSASADKTVRLWDARTGDLLAVFRGHQEAVESAQFTSDGRILSVDKNGTVRVWPIDPVAAAVSRAPRELSAGEREQYEVPSTPR